MSTSYNGWYASSALATRPLTVAGESFVPGILDNDDVFTVLQYVALQMHERVEPIVRSDWHQMDDWGYNYRSSTGNSNYLSCHASGTAIDYNATRHPYGVRGTFTSAQISEVHRILNEVQVVEWGNDWNLPDGMHFEIDGTRAEVATAAYRIRNKQEESPMADYDQILKDIRDGVERSNAQNSRIINKLNKSREREIVTLEELAGIADELDADSPVRRKLNNIITKLKEHTTEDPEAQA